MAFGDFIRKFTTSGYPKLFSLPPAATGAAGSLAADAKGMGTVGLTLLSPVLAPINGAVHIAAWGKNKYIGAWRSHPLWAGLATAAVAVPTALGVANAFSKDKPSSHAKEQLAEVNAAQQEIGQVQGVLGQMEQMQQPQQPLTQAAEMQLQPAPQPVNVPQTLQLANPQVAANSVVYDDRMEAPQLARA